MARKLTNYEKETIINFNKDETIAHIFTYEKTWQKHLEQRLGLKPTMDNGFGGKEYELPKSRIKPPRAPRKLSLSTRGKLAERLRRNRVLTAKNANTLGNEATGRQDKGNSIRKTQKTRTTIDKGVVKDGG